MSPRAARVRTLAAVGAWVAAATLARPAENTAAAAAAPIELPPMLVEESVSSVPWYYVNVGGTEYLSRCSPATTRQFIEAVMARQQLLRALVPEELLARMDVPALCVLYAQDLDHRLSEEIQRELAATPSAEPRARANDPRTEERVNIAPNMRLIDRDLHATIVYIDEALFDGSTLSLAPGHVRYLLSRRVPELPPWLIEGVERMWRATDFVQEPITLRPLVWGSQGESDELASDPQRPRALLPASELFATEVARAQESQHPRRAETRANTQGLFVRWAVAAGEETRRKLWQLAARAAEEPLTEESFEESLGFDFSELRDRLSDYLPKAVVETKRISPGAQPDLPEFEVERATPNQIARVRGEWERLAIGHVQRRLPQVREPYLAQARRTLRRAFDQGDRDPRLLASLGLLEVEAGNDAAARQFLEPAVAAGVVRPRAYHELARLRLAALPAAGARDPRLSFAELAPVIDALRRSIAQAPPLPEAFALLAEAWARCALAPNNDEVADLVLGARLFARRPNVALPIALALARHGRKAEATAVLDRCAVYGMAEDFRPELAGIRAELDAAAVTTNDGR